MRLSCAYLFWGALACTSRVAAQGRLSIVQTYFIPLPEDDLLDAFLIINDSVARGAVPPITSIISITTSADDTIIVYDQWEDGYEDDPSRPTQPSTQIWGDGIVANGAPPGVISDADDRLLGGRAIILKNDVPAPRNGNLALFFDGKDRVSSTFPVAITRSAYPFSPGSLMAGAVEVFNVEEWGTDHMIPVGQDVISSTNAFQMSAVNVMASKNGVTVMYPSSPGGTPVTTIVNMGQNLIFLVNAGDKVSSDYPVQVTLLTGEKMSNYEMRWYAIVPQEKWTDEYYSPVAETFGNTVFWFRNPNNVDITIQFTGGNLDNSGGTFVLPAQSTTSKAAETNGEIDVSGSGWTAQQNDVFGGNSYRADYSGLRFKCTSGQPFNALVQVDGDYKQFWTAYDNATDTYYYSQVAGQGWDWGFPLIPSNKLSSQVLVGLGFSCTNPLDCDRHRSYVWVTPVSDAYIFVDFNGDKTFDISFTVNQLNAMLIQDDLDYDMSGAMIAGYSGRTGGFDKSRLDPGMPSGDSVDIAVAWGQNPSSSLLTPDSQRREMDLGTVVVPLPNPWVTKQVLKVLNPDGTEDPRFVVDQAGDVIVYEISVTNVGYGNFYGLTVDDPIITNAGGDLAYLTGPVETKLTDAILEPGEKFIWQGSYRVVASDMIIPANGHNNITNFATVDGSNFDPVEVKRDIERVLAIISGTVTEDVSNDRNPANDQILEDVLITLTDKNDVTLRTTLTNSDGFYEFQNVEAGDYFVLETNPLSYSDVSDWDEGPDLSKISVSGVIGDNRYTQKDFVDEYIPLYDISGNVTEDINDDNTGDVNLAGVPISLLDANNNIIKTTTTDTDGNYQFVGLKPGQYSVVETNLGGFTDVSDLDGGDLNSISVNILATDMVGNDFVDERRGQILGMVTNNDDPKIPLIGAVIELSKGGVVVATTITTATGLYAFTDLPSGDYTVKETNPADYPLDISAIDVITDGDLTDGTPSANKNIIDVTLAFGEVDDGNNFVDDVVGFLSPYCEAIPVPGCNVCAPFNSIDYCDSLESFPALIQDRTSQFRSNPADFEADGFWFHFLEDKIAGYLFSVDQVAPAPEIFCCETDVMKVYECLESKVFTRDLDGIVIKATNFHSNQGVFVLVNQTGTGTRADPLIDLIQNVPTTYQDALAALSQMQASKIIVEEFIGKRLPTEYKFHIANGTVAAIDIIDDRDGNCPCYAVIDTEGNRLDKFGCFEPGAIGHTDQNGCTAIDFETGKRTARAIKKDLYICDRIPDIDPCIFQEMIDMALDLGNRIGVYMRVDMFLTGNSFYVQEYSANHMNGLRHCAAKTDANGCIDSCFMGRMWNDAGAAFGGSATAVPNQLAFFRSMAPAQQCALIETVQPPKHVSKCPLSSP